MEKLGSLSNGQWILSKVLINSIGPDKSSIKDPELNRQYSHVASKSLPNGLTYKQFKMKQSLNNSRIHALYERNNPEPISLISTADAKDHNNNNVYKNTVNWASTVPEHQKKGLSKQLYIAALMHLGEIHSDDNLSANSNKVWSNLSQIPGVSVKLSGVGDAGDRHRAVLDTSNKIDSNTVFHPVKLY
jgi:hypothetical protein